MKQLTIIFLLMSHFAFSQVKDPVTQIEYKGQVFYIDSELTARGVRVMEGRSILEDMHLTLYEDVDSIPYFSDFEKNLVSVDTQLIMGIPFLSCGIGYRYYELIEEQPSFLLFREVGYFTNGNVGKVIVLNKLPQ
jgi:hypothetical protein